MAAILAAFLGAQLVIAAGARMAGVDPLRAASYARWDSHNYISIATRGYYVEIEGGRVVGGNVAWFPGYSLAVSALASRRLTPARAGKILSSLFALLVLAVLWRALATLPGVPSPALSLGLAALFPGFVYDHAVFPTSMVSAFILLTLVLASRSRYLAAGCCGAAAALTYSTGFLVAVPLALAIALDDRLAVRGKLAALLEGPVLVALGLAAVFAYQGQSVGWDAFARMQRDYFGNAASNPLATFVWNTAHVWRGDLRAEHLPQVQTLLVALLVVAGCALYVVRRKDRTTLDTLLLATGLLYWVFPQVVGRGVSPSRAERLLVVLVPLLARLSVKVQVVLLLTFAGLGVGICALFFRGSLV